MKTKAFLLLCLLLVIGLTQLSAQNGKNGNGTDTFFWVWEITNIDFGPYWIEIPVNCDNTVIDRLEGEVTVHQINHFTTESEGWWDPAWVKQQFDGEVKSASSEVFKVKDILKGEAPSAICPGHFNLVGNKGSHYKVFYTWDSNTNIMSIIKAVCN